jgi:periplasmic protein TonB
LRQEATGAVTTILAINTSGRVDRCRVISSSKSAALDKTTCELLSQRANYAPMLDASGNPVASTVIERVRWMIPTN